VPPRWVFDVYKLARPLLCVAAPYNVRTVVSHRSVSIDARFEIRLAEGERRDLRNCCDVSGLTAAAVVRFGLKWAVSRLNVMASGGSQKTARDIGAFIDEMRVDARLAAVAPRVEAAIAEIEIERDGNRDAAALYDMIGLVAAEDLPLPAKIRLLSDLAGLTEKLT
jgi:hypothetical protein